MPPKKDKNIKTAFKKALKGFSNSLPLIISVILLLGLIKTYLTKEIIKTIFIGNILRDSLIGSIFGSISAGNPITSYIIGGELLNQGISLYAVTSFIIAWVTVGAVQFPAEAKTLGKKFSLTRNITSFILAMIVALITVIIQNIQVIQ